MAESKTPPNSDYGAENIKVLEGLEAVLLRLQHGRERLAGGGQYGIGIESALVHDRKTPCIRGMERILHGFVCTAREIYRDRAEQLQ